MAEVGFGWKIFFSSLEDLELSPKAAHETSMQGGSERLEGNEPKLGFDNAFDFSDRRRVLLSSSASFPRDSIRRLCTSNDRK